MERARTPPRPTTPRREESPLMDDFVYHCKKAYGTSSHATSIPSMYGIGEVITDYEPLKFSSFRVFFAVKGTILQDPVLLMEQVLVTGIFIASAIPVYIWFNQKVDEVGRGDPSMRKWIDGQETRMREFAMIMTILASLLLSFYTAMAVGRWWVIRTAGVGGIKAAAVEIEMLLSQSVTSEPQVLDAVRRYARTSLILVFLWRRKHMASMKEELVAMGLLTESECNQLLKWNHVLHETIWAWQSAIICTLYREGKIKSDMLFRTLLERVSDGRKSVQVIHTHLAVKIPMQYVHLLGMLVKVHNLILAVIMGFLFGAAVRNQEIIICLQLAGRTLILPLLFNAILLINAELSDPFDGHPTDFPGNALSAGLEKDANSLVKAYHNMPEWMARRNPLPP